MKYCSLSLGGKKKKKQTRKLTNFKWGYLFSSNYFFCEAPYTSQLPGAMFSPSGAEPFSHIPRLVSKICRAKTLPSANFAKHHSDVKTKVKLSVPAEEVQLLIMGVKVLLELL